MADSPSASEQSGTQAAQEKDVKMADDPEASVETEAQANTDAQAEEKTDAMADADSDAKGETMEDLFGVDSDSESDGDIVTSKKASEGRDDAGADSDAADGKSPSQAEEEGVTEDVVEVLEERRQGPIVSQSLGKEVYMAKLPNFFSIEPRRFDPDTFQGDFDEEDVIDEVGRQRVKLGVEDAIRWRERVDESGSTVRDSNARLVKWSDGTMSLVLGNEVIDAGKKNLSKYVHLFVGTPDLGGIAAQRVFESQLSFRPSRIEKSQAHKRITMSIAEKQEKSRKVRIITTEQDPEEAKRQAIKREEETRRARNRIENQQRRHRERGQSRGLTSNYLEDD